MKAFLIWRFMLLAQVPFRVVGRTLPVVALALLCSCHRGERAAPAPALDPVAAELDETKRKLGDAQFIVAASQEQLATTSAAIRAANHELAEKEQVLAQRELHLRTLSTELESMKKSEAWIFAEICNLQQQGQNIIAVGRFQKFIKDFPRSSLAIHAERAIADLAEQTVMETQQQADRLDPMRREREARRLLDDGFLTLQELAPKLKNRTRAQVMALLGKPNRVFPDGTEIGYDNRVSSSSGKGKGMLIVTFYGSYVSAIRMDYAGPKLVP